jgi:hypothetical protein
MTTWVTEGPKTNPLISSLLADSGATHVAEYEIVIVGTSTIITPCSFQWRDATNSTTLQEQTFNLMANEPFQNSFKMSTKSAGERFRVITTAGILGVCQVSMMIN